MVKPGMSGLPSTGYHVSLLPHPVPMLPAMLRADNLRRTIKVVPGHYAAGAQQEQALTTTVQQLAALQQEYIQHMEQGHELQQRQARLTADLGLSLVRQHAMFDHMGGAFQKLDSVNRRVSIGNPLSSKPMFTHCVHNMFKVVSFIMFSFGALFGLFLTCDFLAFYS